MVVNKVIHHLGAHMSVQNVVPIHPVDAEIFHSTGENFDLLVALEEKSEDHQSH